MLGLRRRRQYATMMIISSMMITSITKSQSIMVNWNCAVGVGEGEAVGEDVAAGALTVYITKFEFTTVWVASWIWQRYV